MRVLNTYDVPYPSDVTWSRDHGVIMTSQGLSTMTKIKVTGSVWCEREVSNVTRIQNSPRQYLATTWSSRQSND